MGESKVSMINLNEIFQDVKSDLIGKLLNETKDSKTCMWYLMCALDGMPDKEILELAGFTIPQIQAARTEFLMKKYQGNSPVYSEVQKLKSQVKEIVQENRDVRSSIEKGLDKAIQEQIEKSNQLIEAKFHMKKYKHITEYERIQIEALTKAGRSIREIAEQLGKNYSTIWRELQRGKYIHRNGDWTEEEHYSYNIAQERCNKKKKEHGKGLKLGKDYKFVEYIERKILDEKKSLQVALYDIKRENLTFDTDVCLATLYNYVRSGMFYNITMDDMPMPRKKKRIRKRKKQKRASVGTSIDQRPEEINNREQVGHWEMDSVVGPQGKSKKTFLVLTERKSLKEIIEPLKNHSSNEVVRALDRLERELGEKKFREIFKSITVDNGMEFSDHEGIERSRRNKKNRTKVYYCHAYRSCERARNENQNRFIRRFYPKGANFDHITRREVKEIEVWMNDYARKMFDGRTSDEMYELFREEEKEWNMA